MRLDEIYAMVENLKQPTYMLEDWVYAHNANVDEVLEVLKKIASVGMDHPVWEYDRLKFGATLSEVEESQISILNERGRDGWELVAISDGGYMGIFMRQVIDGDE